MNLWDDDFCNYTPDFSRDFFEAGGLPYDEEKDVYKVEDVDYCIDQAMNWKDGIGDFCCDEEYDQRKKNVDVTVIEELD